MIGGKLNIRAPFREILTPGAVQPQDLVPLSSSRCASCNYSLHPAHNHLQIASSCESIIIHLPLNRQDNEVPPHLIGGGESQRIFFNGEQGITCGIGRELCCG